MRRIFVWLLAGALAGLTFVPAASAGHQAEEDCSPGASRDSGDLEVQQPGEERFLYADGDPTDGDGAYVGSDKQSEPQAYLEVEVNVSDEDTVFVHGENRGTGNDGWVKVDGDGVTSKDCAQ